MPWQADSKSIPGTIQSSFIPCSNKWPYKSPFPKPSSKGNQTSEQSRAAEGTGLGSRRTLLASPRLPSLFLKAGVAISQQGTLYIFLDAHLTNSTLPFSLTISLPILYHSLNPDNKTTHGTFVPKKSARLPSHECATGPWIEEQSPASETVFQSNVADIPGGLQGFEHQTTTLPVSIGDTNIEHGFAGLSFVSSDRLPSPRGRWLWCLEHFRLQRVLSWTSHSITMSLTNQKHFMFQQRWQF